MGEQTDIWSSVATRVAKPKRTIWLIVFPNATLPSASHTKFSLSSMIIVEEENTSMSVISILEKDKWIRVARTCTEDFTRNLVA